MSQYKAGFIGLIGYPNAGKSFLMNTLIGEKVSIVTSKPQTTRNRIMGIHSDDKRQVVFVDAPGIIRANKGLNQFLEQEFNAVAEECDSLMCCLSIDEDRLEKLESLIELMVSFKKPWMAVITKRDIGKAHRVPILMNRLEPHGVPIVVVSAKEEPEQTKNEIFEQINNVLPDSPGPLFNEELYTTQNMRDMTRELIRENCFELLQHEVPYGLAIQVKKYEEKQNIDRIHASIVVSKKGHVPIVLGRQGQQIKSIGQGARKSLEKILGKKVFLDLHVSVRENWMNNKTFLKEYGYVSEQ